MTFKSFDKGYALWNDELLLPLKKLTKEGKKQYFRKTVELEDATSYWYYEEPNLYYVKTNPYNKRLVRTNLWKWSPERIIRCLADKEITAHEASSVEARENRRPVVPKVSCTNNWSVEYDEKPILLLVMQKPKMSYAEVLDVIKAEGGYVDEQGIVHKGTAENKVYTLD